MYGKKRSFWLSPVLLLCSALYGLVVRLRRVLYQLHVFRTRSLPCRVISVGNITLGGTGKTPVVIQISKLLSRRGKRPVVISRGYGRGEENELLVVSDGRKIAVDAGRGGDEPFLIASKLPGVPVVVGADRYRAGMLAIERFRPDVLVLDDGYQHVRLGRDLNIALLDASDPFGNGRLFPAGILREPLSALNRADIVLITRADGAADPESLKTVVHRISGATIFTSRQVPVDLVDDMTGATRPLTALRGASVLAFSGIARPASFFSLLRDLGAVVRTELRYPDHYRYVASDLDAITRRATDEKLDMIITTEKDAVRLRPLKPKGIWSLRIEQQIVEAEEWERMVLGIEQRA
jgi:tetraacyldisaccharide 4'-kinase